MKRVIQKTIKPQMLFLNFVQLLASILAQINFSEVGIFAGQHHIKIFNYLYLYVGGFNCEIQNVTAE